jgi:arylsulfatase
MTESAAMPRHVVWIVVDCLRADHLGCYGYTRATSPAIDALAAFGARFEACYPQGVYTLPAHVSMLSSIHHLAHRLRNGDTILYDIELLPDVLARHGFATAGFVSNGMLAGDFGFRRHFDYYDDGILSHDDRKPTFSRAADDTTREALGWLDAHQAGRAFLLVHYNDAHAPYSAPPEYVDRFVDDEQAGIATVLPIEPGDRHVIRPSDAIGAHREVGFYVACYDAAIRYIDEHVGRIVAWLDKRGLREQTLLVVTGDHGEALGEHGYYFQHGKAFYEEFLRVPLIVAGPGIAAGRVAAGPARHVDIVPTILDSVTGVVGQGCYDGRSLLPLLRDGATVDRRLPVFDIGRQSAYIRDGDWKYIRSRDYGLAPRAAGIAELKRRVKQATRRPREELYDLANDPYEQHDLVTVQPSMTRELRERLDAVLASAAARPLALRGVAEESVKPDQVNERLRALGYID